MTERQGLGKRIFKGALWTVLMRSCLRLLGLISVLILARLLAPEDFGLVAKVVLVSSFLDMCSEFGLDNALIKKQHADPSDYNTVWTISIFRGALIGGILIIFSNAFSLFLNEPTLVLVFCCYGLSNILMGFTNVGVVDFRKEMNFHLDFKFNLYLKLSSFIVTIAIAFIWKTYWALAIGVLVRSIASVIASFWMSNFRPKFELSKWRELFDFSKWMFGYGILTAISSKLDTFILSRMGNANELGLYTVAAEISGTPSTEIAMPVARASLPGLSKINDDPPAFAKMYVEIISSVLLIAIPSAIGLSILAEPITLLLLGSAWLDAAVYIQILALYGITRVLVAVSVSALIAFGMVDKLAKLSIATLAIRLVALPTGYYLGGAIGLCFGVLTSGIIANIIYLSLQRYVGMLSLRLLVSRCWRLCLASGCMLVLLQFSLSFGELSSIVAINLAWFVSIGVITFSSVLVILWLLSKQPEGAEKQAFTWIGGKAKNLFQRLRPQ